MVNRVGGTAPCTCTERSGLWPALSQGWYRLLSRVCLQKRVSTRWFPASAVPLCLCLSVMWVMVGCAPPIDGTLILCCVHARRGAGSSAGEPSRCLAKGPGASGYSHILWHRHPVTCVLMLARHFSVLAQKNIIELFYCFRFSCHSSNMKHHQQRTQNK